MSATKIDSLLFKSIMDDLHPEKEMSKMIGAIAFEKIGILSEKYFNINFCQLIINSIESEFEVRKVALIFDVMVWSTPDNGKKLDFLTKNWVGSEDLIKIKSMIFRYEWLPINLDWKKLSRQIIKQDNRLADLVKYYEEELNYWNTTGLRRTELLKEKINLYSKFSK